MMIHFNELLLQLLIIWLGITHSIPLPIPPGVETHTFRWAMGNDLNNTKCAFPSKPWRYPNDTLHPNQDWSRSYRYSILLRTGSTPEDDRITCQANNSIFILIGNPGVIWHPLTGQCVHTKMLSSYVHGIDTYGPSDRFVYLPDVHAKYKTLLTSSECEINNTNVARFKYDQNKLQRLVFLEDNPKTSKQEDWCIRQRWGVIEMVPICDSDPLLMYPEAKPFFHELF